MTYAPAPYTATATVRRGTFEADLTVDGQTPAEAFGILNTLLGKLRLKATRKAHPRPVVTVGLHSRVEVLPDADAYAAEAAAHREELATHAHGLSYALLPGTPELFGEPEPEPEVSKLDTQASTAWLPYAPRSYTRRAPRYAEAMSSVSVLDSQFGGSLCRF